MRDPCKFCGGVIPDTKRDDAIFCTPKCSKTYHNRLRYRRADRTPAAAKTVYPKASDAAFNRFFAKGGTGR